MATKLGNLLNFAAAALLTQAGTLNLERLASIVWSALLVAFSVGISYGSLRRRIEALEDKQKELATKESVSALDEKLDIITDFLRSRK